MALKTISKTILSGFLGFSINATAMAEEAPVTSQRLSVEGSVESSNWIPDDYGMIVVDGAEVLAEDFYKRIGVVNPYADQLLCPNPEEHPSDEQNTDTVTNAPTPTPTPEVDTGSSNQEPPANTADRPDLRLPPTEDGVTASDLELSKVLPEELIYYPESIQAPTESSPQGEQLKAILKDLLTKAHIRNPTSKSSDKLAEDCPETLAAGETCFEHLSLKYRTARRWLFGNLHLGQTENGKYFVKDVYCERDFSDSDFSGDQGTPGPDQIPHHTVVNTEHTWPQSRFNPAYPKEIQKGDLHHLYPTDSRHNSSRGNFRFAEVTTETKQMSCAQNKYGKVAAPQGISADDSIFYEPPAAHKGNVARALFYFSVRYAIEITDIEEYFLRKWHREDPIDQFEVERNQMIFEIQGNRNPFIDFPNLVDAIENF